MTRFEKTRIMGARSLQLAFGAPPLIEAKKMRTPYELARKEFDEKVIPLSIIRNLPNGEHIRIEVN
ncbi:MAG: DNA-directed RNA polymerase subunit K [Candidatus Diapherotrites archaeon]